MVNKLVKNIQSILVFVLSALVFSRDVKPSGHVSLKPVSKNALSLLSDVRVSKVKVLDELPCDITFFFADVKYTGTELKICEFGGVASSIADTQIIINGKQELLVKPYWGLFWHYLKQFNKPILYVGDQQPAITKELFTVGGKAFSSMPKFLDYFKKAQSTRSRPTKIKDYEGIVVINKCMQGFSRKDFLKEYPMLLWVNGYTKMFTVKRHAFQLSDKNPELRACFPAWKIYKKKYDDGLAEQIIKDIGAPFYIIKPINSMQSRGVIMTRGEKLDEDLKLILQNPETIKASAHKSLSYWKKDTNETFFVQAYAPSKTIRVQGNDYDPTMRLVFFLRHEEGVMTVNVVAGYWKIPVKALNASGTLTEKHITKPFSGDFFSGLLVDPEDLKHAKELLASMLPSLYQKMLACGV